jgi:hypothetical protein
MASKKRSSRPSRGSRKYSRRSRSSRPRRRHHGNVAPTHRLLNGRGPYYYEHDVELNILFDLLRARHSRKLPRPGDSVVYDRAYKKLGDEGFIRWVQTHPHHTSLMDDHYALTEAGREAVRLYKAFMKGIGTRR